MLTKFFRIESSVKITEDTIRQALIQWFPLMTDPIIKVKQITYKEIEPTTKEIKPNGTIKETKKNSMAEAPHNICTGGCCEDKEKGSLCDNPTPKV